VGCRSKCHTTLLPLDRRHGVHWQPRMTAALNRSRFSPHLSKVQGATSGRYSSRCQVFCADARTKRCLSEVDLRCCDDAMTVLRSRRLPRNVPSTGQELNLFLKSTGVRFQPYALHAGTKCSRPLVRLKVKVQLPS